MLQDVVISPISLHLTQVLKSASNNVKVSA